MANCTQWKLVPHFLEYTWCKLFWELSKHSTFDSINLYGYANLRTGWALRSERNGKEIGYSGEILNWIFYLKNIHELAHSIEWAFVNYILTIFFSICYSIDIILKEKSFFSSFLKPFIFFFFFSPWNISIQVRVKLKIKCQEQYGTKHLKKFNFNRPYIPLQIK